MIEALIAGGASLLGSHLRNKEARKASARQMAFQRDMSDTSYQRGMADMKKAGLNPILAGKVGGASTPTGSTYNPENVATNATNAYLTTQQNIANVANTKAMTEKIKAETGILDKTSGSGFGKMVQFIEQKLGNIANSESVESLADQIIKQNQDLMNYSAKQANEFKQGLIKMIESMRGKKDERKGKLGTRIRFPDGTNTKWNWNKVKQN